MTDPEFVFPITGDWVCSQLSPKFEPGTQWLLTFFEVPYPGRRMPKLEQLRENTSSGPMFISTSDLCEALKGVPQVWQLDIRNADNATIQLYIEDGEVFEQHLGP